MVLLLYNVCKMVVQVTSVLYSAMKSNSVNGEGSEVSFNPDLIDHDRGSEELNGIFPWLRFLKPTLIHVWFSYFTNKGPGESYVSVVNVI